jgi:hypothetical protein
MRRRNPAVTSETAGIRNLDLIVSGFMSNLPNEPRFATIYRDEINFFNYTISSLHYKRNMNGSTFGYFVVVWGMCSKLLNCVLWAIALISQYYG